MFKAISIVYVFVYKIDGVLNSVFVCIWLKEKLVMITSNP